MALNFAWADLHQVCVCVCAVPTTGCIGMTCWTPIAISEAGRRFSSVGKMDRLRSVPGRCKRNCRSWNGPDPPWLSLTLHLFSSNRAIFLRGQTGRGVKLTVEPHPHVCSSISLMYISINLSSGLIEVLAPNFQILTSNVLIPPRITKKLEKLHISRTASLILFT
jgi:hypothetical protein